MSGTQMQGPKAKLQDAVGMFLIACILAFSLSLAGILGYRGTKHLEQQQVLHAEQESQESSDK